MPKVKFTADAEAVAREFAKLEGKISKLQDKLDSAGKAGKRAGKKMEEGFDPKAVTGLLTKLAGAGGLLMTLRAIGGAFGDIKTRAKEAIAEAMPSQEWLKRLAQISATPGQMAGMRGQAEGLVRGQGFAPAQALRMIFEATSLGFSPEDIEQFGGYRAFTSQPEALPAAVGGLQAAFGPEVGGGSPASAVNSLLAAAKESKAGIEEVAANILTPAQMVKRQGGTFEESVAALAIGGKGLKSFEEAATQIGSLAKAMEADERTRGAGLMGGVALLAGMDEQERKTILMEIRAIKGFGLLNQNAAQIQTVQQAVIEAQQLTGTPESRIAIAKRVAQSDPTLSAMTAMERGRGERMLVEEGLRANPRMRVEAVQEMLKAALVRMDVGTLAETASLRFAARADQFIRDPEKMVKVATGVFSANYPSSRFRYDGPETPAEMEEYREWGRRAREDIENFRQEVRAVLGGFKDATEALNRSVRGGTALAPAGADR